MAVAAWWFLIEGGTAAFAANESILTSVGKGKGKRRG